VQTPVHVIRILSNGFACSCGHNRKDAGSAHDARRFAAQHQLAAFVRGVASGQRVSTTCLGCGGTVAMPDSNSEGLMHDYAGWIAQPCPACGRAPREIVADA
jgi:hypothetical protein